MPLLLLHEQILLSAGYSVISENNPKNAINLALCMQPDLMLLDVVMPDVDGFTVCERLQQNPQTQNIPIIFLTISEETNNKVRGLQLGGIDYLVKPLNRDELLVRVNRHIELNQFRHALEKVIHEQESQIKNLKGQLKQSKHFIPPPEHNINNESSLLEEGLITIRNDFTCIEANSIAAYLLGYETPQDMLGETVFLRELRHYRRNSDLKLSNGKFEKITANRELCLITKDKQKLPIEMDLTPAIDEDEGEIAIIKFTDISMEASLVSGLASTLYKDGLTQLINKEAYYELIKHSNMMATKKSQHDAILIVDLNHFKEINDSFGHLVGDQVLHTIAKRLRRSVRTQDKVARLGGDEFGLLLINAGNKEDLEKQAARLLSNIRQPIKLPDTTLTPSACIGIAIIDKHYSHIEDVINQADMALYKAKSNRKRGYYLFEDAMLDDLKDEQLLETELPYLFESNQLYIEYQPQFSLSKVEYVGAEALLRWNHPTKGKLFPAEFLPIAEKRGFLRNLSNHSLRKVCEQIGRWKNDNIRFGHIAVNICAAQLNDANFYDEIGLLFDQYNIQPDDLILELTESTLFSVDALAKKRMWHLTQRGVKFAIDDFGKGYSSMQLLKDMHADIMKIDKKFVQEIEHSEKSRIIIQAIIDLSKQLKMFSVAEGVETINQLNFLRNSGCDSFQGFYQSQSVPPESLELHFLKREHNKP